MGYREGDHLVFRDDLLRAVEELGGQLLFFMHIAYWDKTLEERWLDYFKSEFKPNKKFYIIFEESEFSTHTLLDLDLIVDFFKKRDVNKDKLIWMVPAHNFTDLVNRYNEYIVKKIKKWAKYFYNKEYQILNTLERIFDLQTFCINNNIPLKIFFLDGMDWDIDNFFYEEYFQTHFYKNLID